ncbi:MAG TPA: hypothetical protein VKV18_07990 [Chthonomonas sp.]|uniref:hypothetical protein n=1 Tax=Chthonomonas sp. TaxID=2282153 RepID=UPI002B4B6215|nr:hypothetical protein [Chthonomonas sp.]HLI48608.1 hypothetical protein [Chthonomonas sp.]
MRAKTVFFLSVLLNSLFMLPCWGQNPQNLRPALLRIPANAKEEQLKALHQVLLIEGHVLKDVYAYQCPRVIVAPGARVDGTIKIFQGPTALEISPKAFVYKVAVFESAKKKTPLKTFHPSPNLIVTCFFKSDSNRNYTLSENESSDSQWKPPLTGANMVTEGDSESYLPIGSPTLTNTISTYHAPANTESTSLARPLALLGLWLYGLLGTGILAGLAPRWAQNVSLTLLSRPREAVGHGIGGLLILFCAGVALGSLCTIGYRLYIAPLAVAWVLLMFCGLGVGWLCGSAALMDKIVERFPKYSGYLTNWPRKAVAGITLLVFANLLLSIFGLSPIGILLIAIVAVGGLGSAILRFRSRYSTDREDELIVG